MAEQLSSFEGIELTSNDESIVTNFITTDSDPSTGGGLSAPVGSLALSTTGRGYFKHNTGNTDWVTVFTQLPGELASLTTLKTGISLADRVLLEDSDDSFNKKYTTVDELSNAISTSLSYGLDFSRRGNVNALTVLLTRDGILSSTSGHPVGISNPVLKGVNVATRNSNTYTLRLFQHDGNSVNRVNIADVVITANANPRLIAGVDFTITNPMTTGNQLGVELIAGTARDIMVEVIISGVL